MENTAKYLIEVTNAETVQVVEYANLPPQPSTPNTAKNTVTGGIIGAVLAMLFILLLTTTMPT